MDEVGEAIWSCGASKAPSPGSFNLNFIIKTLWPVCYKEIVSMAKDFFESEKLPSGVNSSFIALIPKVEKSVDLKEYRSISLVGALYKFISIILAIRLKKVLGNVISDNESSFIRGRQILDGVMLINRLVDCLKKSNQARVILMLDFAKSLRLCLVVLPNCHNSKFLIRIIQFHVT